MLLTVGHGTLTAAELRALLHVAGVELLVDVRRFPGSRRHPHHASEALAADLPGAGIAYRWDERLGGRRKGREGSPHVALRNHAFRAYADWMDGEEFRTALADLLDDPAGRRTAALCAESVWWRCHRRLVADAAQLLHGVEVRHLMHDGTLRPHLPTDGVRAEAGHLVYDVGADRPLLP